MSSSSVVLERLQSFLPEMAAANDALGQSRNDGSGFELEQVEEAEEVLTQDAEAALTAADIAESSTESERPAASVTEPCAEQCSSAAQIHMDLYCGVLEEKTDQDANLADSGVLKLPGGGVLAPPTTDTGTEVSSDDEVIVTSRTMLADGDSDSDSDDDRDGAEVTAGEGLQPKILVQEIVQESESSSLIPGLPDPTDRTLVDKCVHVDAHDRDVMQHVEEAVRWHRRQGGDHTDASTSKCVEILSVSGTDGAYRLQLVITAATALSQAESRQTVEFKTSRTAGGDLEVQPVMQ